MLVIGRSAIISLLLVCGSLNARDFGPALGSKLPGFELKDQDGKPHTLASLLGPKGAVIVFFRSADW
jgi:cytochrome oxidase Cu insertion factor (SCO1/SenC/PrrC family)